MTSIYGPADEGEAIATVHAGQNFIDISDAYAGGMNEEMFAVVLKERRADVFLAPKFGNILAAASTVGLTMSSRHATRACNGLASIRSTCISSTV